MRAGGIKTLAMRAQLKLRNTSSVVKNCGVL